MKKLLIATTMIAAAIGVQAQTVIYGSVGEVLTRDSANSTNTNGVTSDRSRIGLKVTEDLKNGLTARAVIETDIGGVTSLGNRQTTVGLSNKIGSVDLGRAFHSSARAIRAADPYVDSLSSIAGVVHNTRDLRFSNAVFVSATPIAGVAVTADRASGLGSGAYSLSAQTALKGVTFTGAYFNGIDTTSQFVSAQGTVGPMKTQLSVSHSQNADAGVKTRGTMAGVVQPIPQTAFSAKASWGVGSNSLSAYNIGGVYALSKRTTVEAAYRKVSADGTARDVAQVAVGVYHQF